MPVCSPAEMLATMAMRGSHSKGEIASKAAARARNSWPDHRPPLFIAPSISSSLISPITFSSSHGRHRIAHRTSSQTWFALSISALLLSLCLSACLPLSFQSYKNICHLPRILNYVISLIYHLSITGSPGLLGEAEVSSAKSNGGAEIESLYRLKLL